MVLVVLGKIAIDVCRFVRLLGRTVLKPLLFAHLLTVLNCVGFRTELRAELTALRCTDFNIDIGYKVHKDSFVARLRSGSGRLSGHWLVLALDIGRCPTVIDSIVPSSPHDGDILID